MNKTILAMSMALASVASADDLVYQSQTLSGTQDELDGGIDTGKSPLSDQYTIDVKVAGPLAANLSNAVIVPQSWSVTCEFCQVPLSSSFDNDPRTAQGMVATSAAVFMFSTDSAGRITNWSFAISGSYNLPDLVDPAYGGFLSKGTATFTSGDGLADDWLSDNAHEFLSKLTAPPGKWTQSSLVPQQIKQRTQPQVRLWFRF